MSTLVISSQQDLEAIRQSQMFERMLDGALEANQRLADENLMLRKQVRQLLQPCFRCKRNRRAFWFSTGISLVMTVAFWWAVMR